MKLVIRYRDVDVTPELLDHVKHSVASFFTEMGPREMGGTEAGPGGRPHPWDGVRDVRVSLLGERFAQGETWIRCRIEAWTRGGGCRVLEAGSTDALVAVDGAVDRLASLGQEIRAQMSDAA